MELDRLNLSPPRNALSFPPTVWRLAADLLRTTDPNRTLRSRLPQYSACPTIPRLTTDTLVVWKPSDGADKQRTKAKTRPVPIAHCYCSTPQRRHGTGGTGAAPRAPRHTHPLTTQQRVLTQYTCSLYAFCEACAPLILLTALNRPAGLQGPARRIGGFRKTGYIPVNNKTTEEDGFDRQQTRLQQETLAEADDLRSTQAADDAGLILFATTLLPTSRTLHCFALLQAHSYKPYFAHPSRSLHSAA